MEVLRFSAVVLFISCAPKLVLSAEDAITFTSVPDSITFNTVEALHSSEVADIFSTMLSYTLAKPYKWQSLGPVNPMKRPESIYVLDLLGVGPDVQLNIPGTKFPLENLNDLDSQYALLALRTNERYAKGQNAEGKPFLVKINADDELYGPKSEYRTLFKDIPADAEGRLEKAKKDPDLGRTLQEGTFNTTQDSDKTFLVEMETLKLLNEALQSNKASVRDGIPDIFWIKLSGLHEVVKEHGTDSFQTKEAVRMVVQKLTESKRTLEHVYDNRAIMAVITETSLPYMSTRTVRSLLQAETITVSQTEFSGNYSAYPFQNDFNVAFALTAFTTVVLILTVLGVSVAIWFMDPGRDSIIYRMTSQRKKD